MRLFCAPSPREPQAEKQGTRDDKQVFASPYPSCAWPLPRACLGGNGGEGVVTVSAPVFCVHAPVRLLRSMSVHTHTWHECRERARAKGVGCVFSLKEGYNPIC